MAFFYLSPFYLLIVISTFTTISLTAADNNLCPVAEQASQYGRALGRRGYGLTQRDIIELRPEGIDQVVDGQDVMESKACGLIFEQAFLEGVKEANLSEDEAQAWFRQLLTGDAKLAEE